MEEKIRHLEMIQSVINRMANNSFFIKGWCITVIAAILALSTQSTSIKLILIALLPLIMFWMLDGYFLRQERLFRNLYDEVCVTDAKEIDFRMHVGKFNKEVESWLTAAFSKTLLLFYGIILLAIAMVFIFAIVSTK